MKELSLYILDISMNSVRAGAENISISLNEHENMLDITIMDDGCGMTTEQVNKLCDPFFTTRETRKVGLGVPFYKMAAEQTGGCVTVKSKSKEMYMDHGTKVFARFYTDNVDFTPLGDITETVVTLIQGSPEINYEYSHKENNFSVDLRTKDLRKVLGEDVSLGSYEVLEWIREYLKEQYENK